MVPTWLCNYYIAMEMEIKWTASGGKGQATSNEVLILSMFDCQQSTDKRLRKNSLCTSEDSYIQTMDNSRPLITIELVSPICKILAKGDQFQSH